MITIIEWKYDSIITIVQYHLNFLGKIYLAYLSNYFYSFLLYTGIIF